MGNSIKYAFRIVHIDNIPYINRVGFVHPDSLEAFQNYVPIGDKKVIEKRKRGIQGRCLDRYIPFYFGPRSPMLYVIQHGHNGVKMYAPTEIVYCVVRLADIIQQNVKCLFTDGHALDQLSTFYERESLVSLDEVVSYTDVYARYWNVEDDRDLKRRKEAELLVEDELSPEMICGYVVYDEKAKSQLLGYGISETKIFINANYYF